MLSNSQIYFVKINATKISIFLVPFFHLFENFWSNFDYIFDLSYKFHPRFHRNFPLMPHKKKIFDNLIEQLLLWWLIALSQTQIFNQNKHWGFTSKNIKVGRWKEGLHLLSSCFLLFLFLKMNTFENLIKRIMYF